MSITEIPCGGDTVYCPTGAAKAIAVKPGFFSVGGDNATDRSAQSACPKGTFCTGGIKFDCPPGTYGRTGRLTSSSCNGQCYRGHYCPPGSISPTEIPCPVGRYGGTKGLGDSGCSGACPRSSECLLGSIDQFGFRRVANGAS